MTKCCKLVRIYLRQLACQNHLRNIRSRVTTYPREESHNNPRWGDVILRDLPYEWQPSNCAIHGSLVGHLICPSCPIREFPKSTNLEVPSTILLMKRALAL